MHNNIFYNSTINGRLPHLSTYLWKIQEHVKTHMYAMHSVNMRILYAKFLPVTQTRTSTLGHIYTCMTNIHSCFWNIYLTLTTSNYDGKCSTCLYNNTFALLPNPTHICSTLCCDHTAVRWVRIIMLCAPWPHADICSITFLQCHARILCPLLKHTRANNPPGVKERHYK